jgi:hypothetical protein
MPSVVVFLLFQMSLGLMSLGLRVVLLRAKLSVVMLNDVTLAVMAPFRYLPITVMDSIHKISSDHSLKNIALTPKSKILKIKSRRFESYKHPKNYCKSF